MKYMNVELMYDTEGAGAAQAEALMDAWHAATDGHAVAALGAHSTSRAVSGDRELRNAIAVRFSLPVQNDMTSLEAGKRVTALLEAANGLLVEDACMPELVEAVVWVTWGWSDEPINVTG